MLKKINLLLLVIGFITITSCSDEFLDQSPTDAISSADALSTADNMALILQGLHRILYAQSQAIPGGTSSRAGNHYWIPLGDNIGGQVIHSAPANNLGWQDDTRWLSHTQETSTTGQQLWYQRYHVIASANAIINKATDGSIPLDDRLKEIIGQAYSYRAYSYLSLVQHYGKGYLIGNPATDAGVPILFASQFPFESGPRETVQAVYDQCMADIDAAIASFEGATQRPTGPASGKAELNIDVAYGLKARIALNSGQWRVAADAAKAARANYPIMGEGDYKLGFNSNTLPEVIWGSHVISAETTFFRSYFYLISNTFNGSQVRNNPKIADKRLIDALPDTDYRKDLFLIDAPNENNSASNGLGGWANNTNPLYTTEAEFDAEITRLEGVYGWRSYFNAHPYMHVKFKQVQPGGIEPDDVIIMRSSEMYLIEAEAEAMLNNISAAQAALKPLGEARDSAYDITVYNSQSALMNHIKFQRNIELWGEGFRYTDLIRWDEGIEHTSNGGSGASEILYQDGYRQEKPSINNDWVFKIPQREIDANPNIGPGDQN
jgi:hypothetical protein